MNEITAGSKPIPFQITIQRLQDFLQTAAVKFQDNEDAAGIESLINAEDELKNAVEADHNSQQPRIDLSRLLPAVRKLHFYIQNQDIAGITDLLEDVFCPLTDEWLKGCDGA